MFSGPDLAARIDRAEGRLCAAIAGRQLDGCTMDIGGGVAVFAGPDSPSNKVIGAGFDGVLDEGDLGRVESFFAGKTARLQAEVSTLADPAVHAQLAARGYSPGGFENVLGHSLRSGRPSPPAGIVVEPLEPEQLTTLAEVMADAFASPDEGGVGGDALPPRDEIKRWFLIAMSAPGYRGYLARVGAEVAGGAALRLDEGVAQFSGAATLPRFRRRGVQTALLSSRLADAAAAGCDIGVIVTQPASKSQENSQRAGFSLLYARQLLVKAAP